MARRLVLGAGLGATLVALPVARAGILTEEGPETRQGEVRHSEDEW